MAAPLAHLLWRALAATAIVCVIYWLPPLLVSRPVLWLPPTVDAWFLVFAVRVLLFAAVLSAFRVPLRSALRAGVPAAGARAAFWLLSGEVLFALLLSMTIVSTAGAADFRVSDFLHVLTDYFPVAGPAGGALRSFVLAPVFEELLFRVFILGWLCRTLPAWLGLSLSSALFASLHDAPLMAGIHGVVLGLLYLRYRSVALCILVHVGLNVLVTVGAPMLIAHLHETGVFHPLRGNLWPVQLSWFLVVLACLGMFFRCLLDKAEPFPTADPCVASSSPAATPASSGSSVTSSRHSDGRSSRSPS